jgi:choline dehydrogenase-like flavoprotein
MDLGSQDRQYDVCVVGAGPVGLSLALECEAAGLSVLLIEAGDLKPAAMPGGLADAEIADPSRHASLEVTTRSGLGGTSSAWGGRCVPFDPIDFERRAFVRHSGWPIANTDMERWYAKAASYLDCGTGWSMPLPFEWKSGSAVSCESVERLSSQPRLGQRFRPELARSKRLRLSLGQIVQRLELDHSGQSVSSVCLASSDFRPSARTFVLACGGLQSTRLLLDIQRNRPLYFNGEAGPLGRFYMGHLSGRIASIVLRDPQAVHHFDYRQDDNGYWYRRRFCIDPDRQHRDEILNIAFWLGNPPFHDPDHGSAAASSIHLNLRLPLYRTKYFSREFVSFHRGSGSAQVRRHLANVLNDPIDMASGLLGAAKRQLSRDKLRPFFLPNPRGVYALHYHSEQIPDPDNRVRLKPGADGFGRLSIDYRYHEQDARSVVHAHDVLDQALRRSGQGYVKYWQRPEERVDHVLAQAMDGYHQIGTTRMDQSERLGVVDTDCRVHGVKNLYVAGTAVFPTSGQANPTLTAVALAARLADHLGTQRIAADTVAEQSAGGPASQAGREVSA